MKDKYVTVTALTKYIKKKMELDPHLQTVWVRGEISNFKHHSRGHMYLTIKDEQARIASVMFAGNNRRLVFQPENGMKVLIRGQVSVFEAYGQYQLYIHEMEPDGIGALYMAFEQLKNKLETEGLFDPTYKKPIPSYPQHIAVITSPTGAAVRDMLTTIQRRYPIAKVTVIPVTVQGETAVASICEGMERANASADQFDTIIVGRGGGSIEDLWAFNEEKVVRTIFESKIPVISGIGHETDTTISDFAADLRAPTPTGAAELAVPSLTEVKATIQHYQARLQKLAQLHLLSKRERLRTSQRSYAFHKPKQKLAEKEQYLDHVTERLKRDNKLLLERKQITNRQLQERLQQQHPKRQFAETEKTLAHVRSRLVKERKTLLHTKNQQLQLLIQQLTLLNPLHIMKRGFAIPYDKTNKIIKQTTDISKEDNIHVRFIDGMVTCSVTEIRRDDDDRDE